MGGPSGPIVYGIFSFSRHTIRHTRSSYLTFIFVLLFSVEAVVAGGYAPRRVGPRRDLDRAVAGSPLGVGAGEVQRRGGRAKPPHMPRTMGSPQKKAPRPLPRPASRSRPGRGRGLPLGLRPPLGGGACR